MDLDEAVEKIYFPDDVGNLINIMMFYTKFVLPCCSPEDDLQGRGDSREERYGERRDGSG
jgi:hypothetical protein